MGVRRLARQRALQLLFALDRGDIPYATAEEDFLAVDARRRKGWGPFASLLARTTHENRAALDREIGKALTNWRIERLPALDRICLRMGLCELKHFPEIPMRVTLDEYIELARLFGEAESPQFVNGVLDRLARDYPAKDFGPLKGSGKESGRPRAPESARPADGSPSKPPAAVALALEDAEGDEAEYDLEEGLEDEGPDDDEPPPPKER